MKNGKLYKMGKDGKLHIFHGVPKAGDIVWKDGKAYEVGKDGKLHTVKNGEQHIINGKAYVYKDGKWIPLTSKGMKVGDLVSKDGKLYQVGADGKLYAYNKLLKEGQIVWKNGKPYRVNADGKLIPLKEGESFIGTDGKKYHYINGKIVEDTSAGLAKKKKNNGLFSHMSDSADKALLKAYSSEILAKNTNTQVIPKSGLNNIQPMGRIDGTPQAMRSPISAYSAPTDTFMNQDHNANKPLPLDEIKPKTPYTITAGSIIPATLVTGINSDLQGDIKAIVSQNVFDSVTGNYLLIPQGSTLNGLYDAHVGYGQSRVMMVWRSVTFPNGNTINLGGMEGADLQGYMGASDLVDNHYGKVFGSAVLFSLFGAASQLTQPSNSGGSGPTTSQIVYASIGQQLTQTAQAYLQKDLSIQPTLKIRPGDNFQVYVSRNLSLNGAYHFSNQKPNAIGV